MAKKTSANAKASYARYESENRAETNKKVKIARHLAKHPEDKQTQERKTTKGSGRAHTKNTPLEAQIKRSLKTGAFGKDSK